MLIRTHIVITILAILLFFKSVNSQIVFVLVALLATFIPDLDSAASKLGRYNFMSFFTKHRGFFHSFTFLILLTIYFALLLPVVALPFFLGYFFHIFADSFTVEGVKPFWPSQKSISWKITTGGNIEKIIFISFIIIDLFVAVVLFTDFL